MGMGRLAEAQTALKRVVQLNPGRWRSWNGLGVLADLRRDFVTAQRYYQKALLVLPDHPQLLNNRAFSMMMLHRYAEAEVLLRKAVRHAPDDVRVLNNLAWCLAARQHYAEAYKLLQPHIQPAMASNNVGYVAMLQGDYPAAVHYFKQALELSPVFYDRAANNLADAQRRMRQDVNPKPRAMGQGGAASRP
jgi:Flp pilus assembly protein TadD